MSLAATIIFPHHLFEDHPCINKQQLVILIEHARYFSDFSFHKKKLVLHRASMKAYQELLDKNGFTTIYIDYKAQETLFSLAAKQKITHFDIADLIDTPLEKAFLAECKKHAIKVAIHTSPMFLTPIKFLQDKLGNKERYFMAPFYVAQRKRMNILMHNKKPVGGKWSFDAENRKPLPKNRPLPHISFPKRTQHVTQATEYVEKHFKNNPGHITDFWFPVTHQQAKKWLEQFLQYRLSSFGDYEDAIESNQSIMYHSVLSPLLNCGLLTPEYVVTQTINYAKNNSVPINNLEGFIRQIIGWREFVRGVYLFAGEKQRSSNFFKHTHKLPASFWNAKTNIMPIDNCINKAMSNAYTHHIERLMILGNFMLLTQTDPHQAYKWFMEFFIDAYDWVMVPNVYGMSQYADGGLMTTKPYFSGSNYIKKMSNFKSGSWSPIWDSLYWYFIYNHQKVIASNSRLKVMVSYLRKMNPAKINEHIKAARTFLLQYHNH